MLATLDIRKARDAAGREITPIPEFESGAVRHFFLNTTDVRDEIRSQQSPETFPM